MAVDPYHRYSNEAERAKTFKMIKIAKKLGAPWFVQNYFSDVEVSATVCHARVRD